jgi:hypothetical protein
MFMIARSMLAFLVSTQSAFGAAKEDPPIKVMVLVILGNDKNTEINERLREIAPELKKKDPKLTGFSLFRTSNPSMKMGESKQIDLIDKEELKVTVNEKTDDAGNVTITIKPPKVDAITYSCTCGKFFPVFTNYYTADNKRLIIAVMAKPCKK